MRKRMDILKTLTLGTSIALGSTCVVDTAQAASSSTVSLGEVMAMNEMSLGDLVARAKARDGSTAKLVAYADASSPAAAKAGVGVGQLIQGEALSFGALVQAVRPGGSGIIGAPKPKAKANEALTVTVTIGVEPNAEPVAKVTSEAQAAELAKAAQMAQAVEDARVVDALTRAAAAAAPKTELRLEINDTASGLKFSPQSLVLPRANSSARVVLGKGSFDGLAIFVRDQSVANFDQKSMTLSALKKGVTEVYTVHAGKMYIVPVTVEDAGGGWDLKVPDALVSLDGVFKGAGAGSALYPGLETASRTGTANGDGVSLAESLAETERTAREVTEQTAKYVAEKVELGYKPVTLQIIDDRSAPRAGKVYPVANAIVRLVGTEFAARSDATGHLTIRDVPTGSRFLVRIDDEGGIVRSGLAELVSSQGQDGRVVRLRVTRNFSFDAYANIAGVAQHAAYASYCATVVDPDSNFAPIENVAVGIDASGEGPFYFNRYGFLDRALRTTGPDGRFCFYNVMPGPVALSIYEAGAYVATFPISTFPGRHTDEELALSAGRSLIARLAAMGTAHEQLGTDQRVAQSYKTIDMIDLIPLGTETPMMQLAPGRVQTSDPLLPHNGRVHAFAQAAEFEPTIYGFGLGSGTNREGIVPLVPRGFVEDMSVYAQVAYNPEQGVVLTEYGHPTDVDAVTLRLVDQDGRDVGDGWYFSDKPLTKAIFFNVPAGTYALIAETSDGFWLGADTVVVYNETVSYARLGAPVRYRP